MKKVEKLAQEIREYLAGKDGKGSALVGTHKIKRILDKHVPNEKPFPKIMSTEGDEIIAIVHKNRRTCTIIEGKLYNYKVNEIVCLNEGKHLALEHFKDCEIEIKPCT